MQPQIPSVVDLLSENGPLANQWPGYAVRQEQIRLAEEVQTAIHTRISMAMEASTGTGKTLSYLLPALISQAKVMIAVGNLTLQDHLWWGEYQKLRTIFPHLRQLTVLKGCDNYFCLQRFQQLQDGTTSLAGMTQLHGIWTQLTQWLMQTKSGEIQTLPVDSEQMKAVRPLLTLSADQCSGKRCPHFEDCFFQKARANAANAEVLLINHTLLLSDDRLFEKGMGALLPSVETVIVDEAHQLPDQLMRRNTETIEEYGLQRWLKQVKKAVAEHIGLFADLPGSVKQFEHLWQQIRTQLQALGADNEVQSVSANSFLPLINIMQRILAQLEAVHLSSCDVGEQKKQLTQWLAMLTQAKQDNTVLYCDLDRQQLRLVAARINTPFANLNTNSAAWVFISATLTVDNSFDYFKRCLSLPGIQGYHHSLAMDYQNQSLLWIPAQLPDPADEQFYSNWVDTLLLMADRLEGGMLLLFSSHQALRQSAELLANRTDRTLLVYEPDANRHKLLQQFRQDTSSLLLATGSFWEGIDVSGSALRCVAIDKLPFAAPDDVLSLAWKFRARQESQSFFNDYMVPQAITRLRQGVGRLLRSPQDNGVVILGDNRILKKNYGTRFLSSIPPMPMANSLEDVNDFLKRKSIFLERGDNV